MAETRDTLVLIGKLNGMSEQEVEACGKDQALLDKIAADQRYALDTLKVEFDSDLLRQWRTAQGRDVIRGTGREAETASEALTGAQVPRACGSTKVNAHPVLLDPGDAAFMNRRKSRSP